MQVFEISLRTWPEETPVIFMSMLPQIYCSVLDGKVRTLFIFHAVQLSVANILNNFYIKSHIILLFRIKPTYMLDFVSCLDAI